MTKRVLESIQINERGRDRDRKRESEREKESKLEKVRNKK